MKVTLQISRIIGVIAVAIFTIYTLNLTRYFQQPYILGYETNTIYNLIRILFPVPLAMFGFWVSYTKVFEFLISIKNTSDHVNSTLGKILDIKYSNTRVGNRPLYKVTVEYEGLMKEFDYINEDIQHHFKIGDPILVRYNSINKNDASIDMKGTFKENTKTQSENNARFKLIEINSTPEISNYELIGELMMPDLPTRKVSLNQVIEDNNLTKFIPGMIIPCKIDDSGDELNITMAIS